jgi:hypothetical protein
MRRQQLAGRAALNRNQAVPLGRDGNGCVQPLRLSCAHEVGLVRLELAALVVVQRSRKAATAELRCAAELLFQGRINDTRASKHDPGRSAESGAVTEAGHARGQPPTRRAMIYDRFLPTRAAGSADRHYNPRSDAFRAHERRPVRISDNSAGGSDVNEPPTVTSGGTTPQGRIVSYLAAPELQPQ